MFPFSLADPGSGIWCFFDPWIRYPGRVKNQDPESGMNILDHISETLETSLFLGENKLKFFDADPDSGSEIFLNLVPG
jgi:hypothetical protein